MHHYSSQPLRRMAFFSLALFLLCSLRSIMPLLGFEALRTKGTVRLFVTNATILVRAMSLFSSCERVSLHRTTKRPSLLILDASFKVINSFSSAEKQYEPDTNHKASAMVSTLFTFCPPLPPLRAVR